MNSTKHKIVERSFFGIKYKQQTLTGDDIGKPTSAYTFPIPHPMFPPLNTNDCEKIDSFKNDFAEWDEWTGSRYVRRANPNTQPMKWVNGFWPWESHHVKNQDYNPKAKGICRSCAVTGEWFAL